MRPVILGIARGHSAAQLRPFIVSLRRCGYQGDVCLFVDKLPGDALTLLDDHGVFFQPFPERHFVQARRFLPRMAAALAASDSKDAARVALSQYYLHLIDARWAAYAQYLNAVKGLHSHVMFTDVKDVIFQRDPFDFDWKGAFCSFEEGRGFPIRDEPKTRGWIEKGYGAAVAREMGGHPVICAGVSLAEIDAAHEYLRLMCGELIRINSRGLVDQGVHNYLLRTSAMERAYIYKFDETPVLHLGMMPQGQLPVDEQGLVVNGSSRVANAIHQYAKHPIRPDPASY